MSEQKLICPLTASHQDGLPGHCFQAQIFSADGRSLACIDPTDPPQTATDIAALIVRATNCHAELVEALSEISELRMHDIPASSSMTEYDLAISIIRKARGIAQIALAKATGETP